MFARSMKMIAGTAAIAAIVAMGAGRTGVTAAVADEGPALQSIGPMTFGPGEVLFASDPTGATIYALDLGERGRHRSEDRGDARHRRGVGEGH